MADGSRINQIPQTYISSSDYRSAMAASFARSDEENDEEEHYQDPLQNSHPLAGQDDLRKSFQEATNSMHDEPLIEPPSYADAIFTPYMGEGSINGSLKEVDDKTGTLHSPSASVSTEYLNISVTHPQKMQEQGGNSIVPGSNTYVTYMVATQTNIPEYGGANFTVRRRFRDFVTLGDRLAETYRGYFIPPRPDKSIVESQVMQKQEFIEQRRISLERYLHRLAEHPILRKSEELRLFLQSQGKLPLQPSLDVASRMLDGAVKLPRQLFGDGNSSILVPQEATLPAKGGRDLLRMFKELKQSVTNDWGGAKPLVVEEDKEFIERKEKLQDLEQELLDASQQAEVLVKAQQEVGEVMGELGLAFIKLTKFESEEALGNDQKVHAVDTKRLATAAVKASRFYREANAQSVKHLDNLHEYLGMMQAVHTAFSDRASALLTLQTLMTDISTMQGRIEKLSVASSKVFGGDRSRNRKVDELKESLKLAEESRECAQTEYEYIKERNRGELDRYEFERQRDFFQMLKGFVHTQVAYSEKIAHVWTKVVEEGSGNAGKSIEPQLLSSP